MGRKVREQTSEVGGFWDFIGERHRIYLKRNGGDPPPWTEDEILQRYKFTNVFRQLDRGTVALDNMMQGDNPVQIVFNVWWYRLFNLDLHARWVPIEERKSLYEYLRERKSRGEKIFTSAHMTTGESGRSKLNTYIDAVEEAAKYSPEIAKIALETGSMEKTFEALKQRWMIGKFVAYEIVCDLRFLLPEFEAWDKLSWANVGPGAERGLIRIGMKPTIDSIHYLWQASKKKLPDNVRMHHPMNFPMSQWRRDVPFEMREIEHCLCEFDKYERTRLGVGRPRQRYRP